jgi:signal transduction histidine kinase
VNNSRKHAPAAHVTVELSEGEHGLGFVVSDDGPGLGRPEDLESFGLISMRDRMIGAGGRLELRTGPGGGTTVEGFIPR